VNTKNQIVGVSAFIVAGDGPIETIASGQAVIASAWDVTSKQGVRNTAKQVTAESTSMIASTSKLITWTALSMLLDAGKFDLDDPIDAILSFQIRNPSFPSVPITYKHLYTHTTGIKDESNRYLNGDECPSDEMYPYSFTESLEQSVRLLVEKSSGWSSKRPGSIFRYSNYGTAVAAMLVEKHSGMSFPEFTKKYIFEPLQMTATSWSRPTDGSATELYTLHQRNGYKYKTNAGGYCYPDYPSGQLWTTSGDLAKFSLAMLKRGNLGYTTSDGADCLYTEETGAMVFERISPSIGDGDSALGWFAGDPYYAGGAGHDGSETGISAEFYVHLQNNVAVGYWANGELSNSQSTSILNQLMQTANSIGPIENDYDSNNPQQCTVVLSVSESPSPPTAPTPTSVPNASPKSSAPITSPTAAPVASPPTASSCSDSTLRFKVFINGRNRFKRCNWVKWNKNRCNKTGASEACPQTCGTCSVCKDSTTAIKIIKSDGSKMNKSCDWATEWRCANFDGLPNSCRRTCGLCQADDPTY